MLIKMHLKEENSRCIVYPRISQYLTTNWPQVKFFEENEETSSCNTLVKCQPVLDRRGN
jgi:hypothetical protein